MVICLKRGANCLHMVQLMPLHSKTPSSLASFESRLVLPFWYRLAQVVLEKRPLNECISQWRHQGGRGEASPLWADVQKLCNMCVCSHCHGTSSYHTTNTLQGRRAKSHVDTQTIQPGLGTTYSRPPIDPYLTSPLLQNPGGAIGTSGSS